MERKAGSMIDIELIIGTLELDCYVALKSEKELYHRDKIVSPEEAVAFENGFESASKKILLAVRDILNEHMSEKPLIIADKTYPHARSKLYRSEPAGWQILDTTATELKERILGAASTQTLRRSIENKNPAVVFDLDGTLVDVSYRTLGILKEWLASDRIQSFSENLIAQLKAINLKHIGYGLAHVFENAGLDFRDEEVAKIFESTEKHWRKRFFDGRALVEYDRAIGGATEFVWALLKSGIQIIYLTGRNRHAMEEGTREQLKNLGFPCNEAMLYMKADHRTDDHVFKETVFREVSKSFDIIGNFENEYINLKSMLDTFSSECIHTIVDSQHSGRPVPENKQLVFRISDYS